jgi:hypothetical protein
VLKVPAVTLREVLQMLDEGDVAGARGTLQNLLGERE